MLYGYWGGRVGEIEDVLGQREERVFVVCWFGTHVQSYVYCLML